MKTIIYAETETEFKRCLTCLKDFVDTLPTDQKTCGYTFGNASVWIDRTPTGYKATYQKELPTTLSNPAQ